MHLPRFRFTSASRALLLAPVLATALMGTVLSGVVTPLRYQRTVPDFDADGLPDVTIWRPPSSGIVTNATFYTGKSSSSFATWLTYELGAEGDVPVAADYDGDGKIDYAVYRPTTHAWYVLQSSQNYTATATYGWGLEGDIAVPGDYDGDGRKDIAVYRSADHGWYVLQGGTNFTTAFVKYWGDPDGTPVPADYDNDGRLDMAVFSPNGDGDGKLVWYVLQGGTGFTSGFKLKYVPPVTTVTTLVPVPGDYDGDGKLDLAVYNTATNTFTVNTSATGFTTGFSRVWGVAGDLPVPGDYDHDGRIDMAVFRQGNGTYYWLTASSNFNSGSSQRVPVGGTAADLPVQAP